MLPLKKFVVLYQITINRRKPLSNIDKFLKVVANDEFVEGHEVLEDSWRELKNNPQTVEESKILKGLINGSTALALKILGKEKGAKTVWATFEKYRSLIDTKTCDDSAKYKLAEQLLDEKYKLYM
jgi:hypothetical protein